VSLFRVQTGDVICRTSQVRSKGCITNVRAATMTSATTNCHHLNMRQTTISGGPKRVAVPVELLERVTLTEQVWNLKSVSRAAAIHALQNRPDGVSDEPIFRSYANGGKRLRSILYLSSVTSLPDGAHSFSCSPSKCWTHSLRQRISISHLTGKIQQNADN
jgi:hypothetical protein